MKPKLIYLGILIALFSISSCKQETKLAPRIPMEDFFRNPEKAGYRISPNGKMIIFRAPHMGRMNVFVQELGDTTAIPVTHETERSIYDAFWESDDRIIFVKDQGGDENTHVLSVKPDGTGLVDHTPFEKVRSDVLDILEDIPDQLTSGI